METTLPTVSTSLDISSLDSAVALSPRITNAGSPKDSQQHSTQLLSEQWNIGLKQAEIPLLTQLKSMFGVDLLHCLGDFVDRAHATATIESLGHSILILYAV